MPVKQRNTITKRDFEDALDFLNVSVSEIAKGSGLPRAYLSDLKTRNVPLRREHDEKLRAYLEGQGVQFEDKPSAGNAPDADGAPPSPHPRLRTVEAVRCFFPIADAVPDEVVARAMDAMEDNDARLIVLLQQEAARDDGFLGSGDFAKETKAALQEAGTLLAENYILFRMLRGWPAFGVKPAGESVATLRDVLLITFRARLEQAGLIEPEPAQSEGGEKEPEAA